jgi:flagellar capping protein FliD
MLKDFAFVYTTLVGPIPDGLESFFTESQASKCMTLSKEWDVACEIVDFFHPKNAYRLSKTLEIISWYKQKVADNPDADRSTFTCEMYWDWLNAKREAAREAKAEREKKELELRDTYSDLKRKYENLQAEFSATITQMQSQISKLESDLAERDRKLAALSKPFNPLPVRRTHWTAPVF